ncbi:MAG: hypothetical protein ACKOCN_10575 [Planctomycetaceae bacterium]
MSVVFMSFAVAIFSAHTNYRAEIERSADQVRPGEQIGWKYRLAEAKQQREQLEAEINTLTGKVRDSEATRDRVIAQIQATLVEKNSRLEALVKENNQAKIDAKNAQKQIADTQVEIDGLTQSIQQLRENVASEQTRVKAAVERSAELAGSLQEKEAFLRVAEERKAQLERQLAGARETLKAAGLPLEGPPPGQVPVIQGKVSGVADGLIEITVGGHDGVRRELELEVFREARYVGRVQVVDVMPDKAFARPIKAFMKGAVQQGDRVATKLL